MEELACYGLLCHNSFTVGNDLVLTITIMSGEIKIKQNSTTNVPC